MGRGDFSGGFANTVIGPWALNSGVIIALLPIGQANIASSPKRGISNFDLPAACFDVDLALGRGENAAQELAHER
jgi:hypothetical protein